MFPFLFGRFNLEEIFKIECKAKNIPNNKVEKLLHEMPDKIKKFPVYIDKINNKWCYLCGSPYETKNFNVIGINDQLIHIEKLINALLLTHKYLSFKYRQVYYNNLIKDDKHIDHLHETDPLRYIKCHVAVDYEALSGVGNKTIDWSIRSHKAKILIEVKHRIKPLLSHIGKLSKPLPTDLFKSVEQKFKEKNRYVQGVWIRSSVRFQIKDLKEEFKKMNHKKIHFVVISGDKSTYCLTRNRAISKKIKKIFSLPKNNSIAYKKIPANAIQF